MKKFKRVEEDIMCDTKEEWWQLVDSNWDALEELIRAFWINDTKLPITAENAELARSEVLEEYPVKEYDYNSLKQSRNPELSAFFDNLYWKIPESTDCWKYRGFGVLCDLCSESYVLFEDE